LRRHLTPPPTMDRPTSSRVHQARLENI
jgi:hypothetical protein